VSNLTRYILVPALVGGAVGLVFIGLIMLFGDSFTRKPGYADAVKLAGPSVVNIFSTKMRRPAICEEPRFREWCDRFSAAGRSQVQSSLGSGVVVHPDGFIVTNVHIIDGADEILVAFEDGRTTPAALVGRDPETDLAVIRVPFDDLTPIRFGSSDAVEVGDVALAIGNPFGIGQTVSAGIISAKGRAGISRSPYDDFIQTDAAINPGNSGGALIDTNGRLIGINTLIFTRSSDSAGVGFAIPAKLTLAILTEIIETGRVTRGWLGVSLAPSPAPGAGGYPITGVELGGPAAAAGLRPGDVVMGVNGREARTPEAIVREIGDTAPDEEIRLEIRRGESVFEVRVVAGLRPELP
jgi:serine protease DegS